MLGPPKAHRLDEPLAASLEDLVPPDHFYRHLERSLDLAFVRDFVRDAYAERGRPSIDPVVFFKLQLILFFEGLRSERQLMRVVADRLSLRWYLGYGLSEALLDHSSLTRIARAVRSGGVPALLRGDRRPVHRGSDWSGAVSSTLTRPTSRPTRRSTRSGARFAVQAHLARLFEERDEENDDDTGGELGPTHLPVVLPDEALANLAERAADRHGGSGRWGVPTAHGRAAPIGEPPTIGPAPRIRMRPRSGRAAAVPAWATATTTSSTAARRGSS